MNANQKYENEIYLYRSFLLLTEEMEMDFAVHGNCSDTGRRIQISGYCKE